MKSITGQPSSYPLSPLQAGMLFQSLYRLKTGIDIQQMVCSFKEIDIAGLEFAWKQVWQTHEVLRTSFEWFGLDDPVQCIHSEAVLPWRYLDWRNLPGDWQERLEAFLRQDRLEGFELNRPPLMRLVLIQVQDGSFRLVWTFHHILLDGRSYPVILRQLAMAYRAYLKGETLELPALRPYRDYITWLNEQDLSRAKAYWKDYLRGIQHPTPLGLNRSQPALPEGSLQYGVLSSCLSTELTASLQRIAREHSLTLNTLLQGAWAVLLSRYSGEQDIVFGTLRTGRHTALNGQSTGEMIGLLINTLPVRVQVDPEAPFLQVLQHLRASALELRDPLREHVSLAEIQQSSELQAGARLFDSMIAFENRTHDEALKAQHPVLAAWDFQLLEHVGYPLVVSAYAGDQLKISLEYSLLSFDAETAQRILGHLQTVLRSIAHDPLCPASRLPVLTEAEAHQILVEWNSTQVDYPRDTCIHELFEAQAAETPDAVALIFERQQLSYRELNHRANQLAHHLRALGVGPETLVGICMERSLEMVIGLLGILKSGGAYVPLDPTYPVERFAFMLEDAGVRILLTQEKLLALLVGQNMVKPDTTLLCLDRDWIQLATQPVENPAKWAKPENLIYMIYTSGSTGRPKGALNNHAGLFNRIMWGQSAYPLTRADRILQKTPFSFDISSWEFFWPLMFGACLVVARPEGHKDPRYLVEIVQHQKITTIHFVPSMLYAFLDTPGVSACHSLKRVICSGEALSVELVNRLAAKLPVELHNLYGPTEASVEVSYWDYKPGDPLPGVPIGRPVANTQLYILDHYLQPVPVGVPGELHIGGVQVCRGYLHRPELTAEKFIPNPFGAGRLYKTGDLTRFRADGNIEYLGRIDHQVKIRGFRIELGEIETALKQHPEVQDVVATARAEPGGSQRLVAYLVIKKTAQPAGTEPALDWRGYLKNKLPDYMVPSAFVLLEQFPLTPNGKIDRRALPEPEFSRASETSYAAARTPLEEKLLKIWSEILRIENLGIHDNFFDLGGHSLLATRLFVRIRDQMGLELPLRALFEEPTIAELAARIENMSWATQQGSSMTDEADQEEILL